ncbi:CHAT domain-containing protein [Agromyces sp. Marseille-P2726]|uniref:CHAT domain-containing protein n=1 Tax=Agromyces sp. Marseille-P2726 TaxID=2709132 RepID=UPI00156DF949|nr:CHAT domain-containing protein [Agromyces sp. Marseille-P2726]
MNTVLGLEVGPGPEPGSYVVHVLRSVGGGEPSQTVTLDFDDLIERRPLLEATVLSSSVSARRVISDTEAVLRDVGRRLFDSAFSGDIRTAYRTSMAVASERGTGVQIALRLTAPGLAALPWEALFDEEAGIYLCRKEPLVRQVPAPHSPATLSIEPPMRVLGMIASPRGLPALDVDGERERLEEALRPHLESGRVVLEWLDDVTWTGVHGKLLEDPWHVLHFVGHGTYDVETDEGVLAFVGRDGRADYVTASSLADLLDEAEPTPRLVVLNSCQSGAGGTSDLFSGTAAALAHSGIRAVAAMQFSISDDAAIEFARGFYTALSHGRGIDEAVRSGRIGILGMGRGTLEWVTPVLYLRGEDAKLFDVAPMAASTDAPTEALAAPFRWASPQPPNAEDVTEAPWWTKPTGTQPARGSTGRRAGSAAARPPTRPPMPPASRPTPAATPPSRWTPWLVVSAIAALAIAGAITTVALVRPPAVEQILTGSTGQPVDADELTGQPANAASAGEFVKQEAVFLTDYDWTYTQVVCDIGDEYRITAKADGSLHEGAAVGPDGLEAVIEQAPYPDYPLAALLVGVRGSNTLELVGSNGTYTCPSRSELKLGVNDDTHLEGNAGQFTATVWKLSDQ